MFDLRQRKNDRPLLVGHRGAMAVAPGNTFASLEAGLAGGADILELDVQLTADGQVILFHDTTLTAKTGVNGRISDHTAEFLQSLDVGSWFDPAFAGAKMPLLSEVLNWAKGRIPLMIELKNSPTFAPALDQAVVRLVEDFSMCDEVVITSFDHFALRRIKTHQPNITTSAIYIGRYLDPMALFTGFEVDALSPATDFLTKSEVARIRWLGYACSPGGFTWDYATLINWGVDTVSSNDPAAMQWPV